MSIEQTNIVDFVSTDENDNIVLTISDHLEWDDANRHLLILQEKLNTYLAFIETGQIFESYPSAHSRKIVISIKALHHPNVDGKEFLKRAQSTVENAGYGFRFQQQDLST